MKHMKTIAIILISSAMLSGCATAPQAASKPILIVDMQGVDKAAYNKDAMTCWLYANDVQDNTGNAALAGGLFGAVLGGMAGNHKTAAVLGLAGAGQGAAQANGEYKQEFKMVLRNCLAGRGYRVLN